MHKQQGGFTISEILVAAVACLVVVIIGLTLQHKLQATNAKAQNSTTHNSATSTGTRNSNEYAILAPATVPPKSPECHQQLTFSSGGDSGPVTCANGDLNVTEWNSLDTLEPTALTLGYNATISQVQTALCADVHANVSNAIEETVYQIASLYYGWHFTGNPSSVLTNGTCVNTDD